MGAIGQHVPEIIYYVHRKCSADWVIINNEIDFHDVTYILSGKGTYIIGGEEHPVAEGDLIYISPGSQRQAWTLKDAPMEVFAINFFHEQLLPFENVNALGRNYKLVSLFTQLTRVWMEREEMYTTDAGALAVQIFCELYRRLCARQPVNQIDGRVERVKDYIDKNYYEKLSLSVLAKLVGLNPVYLGALFAKQEACKVSEYINKVRVQKAYKAIQSDNLSVNDVAIDCGFSDPFYFSRVFKKYTGISPSKVQVCKE